MSDRLQMNFAAGRSCARYVVELAETTRREPHEARLDQVSRNRS